MTRIVAILAGLAVICLASPAAGAILSSTADWSLEGEDADDQFGNTVSTAGDVNCDGFSDIVVGARYFTNGETDEGRAYVFHGSLNGPELTASWTAEGNQVNAHFSEQVATAGDVDGDNCSDIVVTSSIYSNPESSEGQVWVYHGSPSGLNASANWIAEGNVDGAQFGRHASTAGDVNSDGYSDLLVRASGLDRNFIYHGSATGLPSSPDRIIDGPYWAAAAGDVDGDGYSDLLLGEPLYDNGQIGEGRLFIYRGSAAGLEFIMSYQVESNNAGDGLGSQVATAGDVNGDGYSDVFAAAPGYENGELNEAAIMVFHGSATGLSPTPDAIAEGNCSGCGYAQTISPAGDVNGDGYADIIVGAWLGTADLIFEGTAYVYLGSAGGISPTRAWVGEGDQTNCGMGYEVSMAGDVNGDGFSDVIVGARSWDGLEDGVGQARVYFGSAEGLSPTSGWSSLSGQPGSLFGYSVASAGDVNGDSFSDVIVGAHGFDVASPVSGRLFVFHGAPAGLSPVGSSVDGADEAGAMFGRSVASAGDVNADGYSDVIVGSPGFDGGAADAGRVYVYHGSPGGVQAGDSWNLTSLHAGATLGQSVASAGDVNGDGYADIVIGAPGYQNGEFAEGRTYLYLGSANGLCDRPDWIVEGGSVNAQLGTSVASAGDINRDGYSDVIVGLPGFSNANTLAGRVQLYLGGAAGLSLAEYWAYEGSDDTETVGQAVSTAGDVDRDGYSDVLVGVPGYSNGEYREGRAILFLGPSISSGATTPDWAVETDDVETQFGSAVATAGDVNGDGYSDVIVGGSAMFDVEVGEGMALVYLGGPGGLALTPDWTADSDDGNAAFGGSVSCAGDVNADGYSDVIVGAQNYASEGAAFLYYGNRGPCGLLTSQQTRWSSDTPVQLLGRTYRTNGAQFLVLLNTPAGRARVRPIVEIKPLGSPLDLTGLNSGSFFDSEIPPQTIANGFMGPPLLAGTPYHWRIRLQHFPFLDYTRWVSAGPNGAEETDFRTNPSCTPIGPDTNCDGVDDDCDGPSDEDYIPDDTCGLGYCQQNNTPSMCLSSIEFDCQPGSPISPVDDTCNGVDEDCDGLTDDEADPTCDDGTYCNGAETCVGGACQPGTPPDCDDGVACTDDSCDGSTDSCVSDPNDALCDDGEYCTGTEICDAFLDCQPGAPPNCNDGITCTVDSCNESTDTCDNTPDNSVCDDGQYCSGIESCDALLGCQAGSNPDCSDAQPCTIDSCNEASDSCDNLPDDSFCYDGNVCTLNTCNPTVGCQTAPNNGVDCSVGSCDSTCLNGLCDGCTCNLPSECDDGVSCTVDDCTAGMCINLPEHDQCDDGAWCSGLETCDPQDDCQFGVPQDCDDGINCTEDLCDELNDHCDHSQIHTRCNDNLWCNGTESCDLVLDCQPGIPVDCNDQIACTDDLCDDDLDICDSEVSGGMCLIDGACAPSGTLHPQDPCQACRPEVTQLDWSPQPPGTACGESTCQGGMYTPAPTCDALGVCVPGSSTLCQSGICADESECQGSGPAEGELIVSLGTPIAPTRIRADMPGIVLRLNLEAEAVPGRLTGLRLHIPGLEDIPVFWRWVRLGIHLDADSDDELGPEDQEIGTALLVDGVAWFDNLDLDFGGLTRHKLLVVMSVVLPETAGMNPSFPFSLLAILALAWMTFRNRRRLRKVAPLLLLVSIVWITPACTRYGYLRSSFDGQAQLASNEDVQVSCHPDDTLTVTGAPIEDGPFILDLSR